MHNNQSLKRKHESLCFLGWIRKFLMCNRKYCHQYEFHGNITDSMLYSNLPPGTEVSEYLSVATSGVVIRSDCTVKPV